MPRRDGGRSMVSHWVKGPTSTSRDFNVSFNGGRQIVSPAACHAPERVLWGACRFAMKITALWDPVDSRPTTPGTPFISHYADLPRCTCQRPRTLALQSALDGEVSHARSGYHTYRDRAQCARGGAPAVGWPGHRRYQSETPGPRFLRGRGRPLEVHGGDAGAVRRHRCRSQPGSLRPRRRRVLPGARVQHVGRAT